MAETSEGYPIRRLTYADSLQDLTDTVNDLIDKVNDTQALINGLELKTTDVVGELRLITIGAGLILRDDKGNHHRLTVSESGAIVVNKIDV